VAKDTIRVFISSPGDVEAERRRAALVIERLARDYARFCEVRPYLWEYEPMLASGHFQDVIEPPSQSDVVVLILWSRLGTPLPERTSHREYRGLDGRAPVTGTEWEFEEALRARQERGAPDLLVYRNRREPQASLSDIEKLRAQQAQFTALEGFWQRHFAERGQFKTAYAEYLDLEAFTVRLERDLRALIERRIGAAGREAATIAAPLWRGNPFRALESYDYEHAPVFFGRAAWIQRGVEQLAGRARAGTGFLLVVGASGAGKSSLVKAGLLPALFTRGVVSTVGLWRRVVFRPGTGALFEHLAAALVRTDESGEVGLPELVGPGTTVADLARHLAQSSESADYAFRQALGQVREQAVARHKLLPHEQAALVLVVDQLEELFTDAQGIPDTDRKRFVALLAALARSGLVYVIGTLRGDFWHRAMELPDLVALSEGQGRLDLLAPGQAELAEMIRRPAEASGLSFEDDHDRGVRLDADLAEAASRQAGSLPLLSAVLDGLYLEDAERAGRRQLTYATYNQLGRLTGAIAKRAEDVLAAAFAAEPSAQRNELQQKALARVLRALATVDRSDREAITARPAALATFVPGSPERRLVEAMLAPDARLLVADADGGEVRLRVAHEALLTNWERAQRQLATDRRHLQIRARVEQMQLQWRDAAPKHRSSMLLHAGLQLTEAVELLGAHRAELDPPLVAYIDTSRRAVSRRRFVGRAAALGLAAGAGSAAYITATSVHRSSKLEQLKQVEARRTDLAGDLLAYSMSAGQGGMDNVPGSRNGPYYLALKKYVFDPDLSLSSAILRAHQDVLSMSNGENRPQLTLNTNGELFLQNELKNRKVFCLCLFAVDYKFTKTPGAQADAEAFAGDLEARGHQVALVRLTTPVDFARAMRAIRQKAHAGSGWTRRLALASLQPPSVAPKPVEAPENTLAVVYASGIGMNFQGVDYFVSESFDRDKLQDEHALPPLLSAGAISLQHMRTEWESLARARVFLFDVGRLGVADLFPPSRR